MSTMAMALGAPRVFSVCGATAAAINASESRGATNPQEAHNPAHALCSSGVWLTLSVSLCTPHTFSAFVAPREFCRSDRASSNTQ